jgi:hypothetical protein
MFGKTVKNRFWRFPRFPRWGPLTRDFWPAWVGVALIPATILLVYAFAPRIGVATVADFVHLVLLGSVLLIEVWVLFMISAESRELADSMQELRNVRIALGRASYMEQIVSAISRARGEVIFTTATMEASWKSKEQGRVLEAVQQREGIKAYAGAYTHRGLVAKRLEALPGTIELLSKTNVKLKMSQAMAMSRLRFLVKDLDQSIIGVAEGPKDLSSPKPTTMSFSVESRMLAMALRDRFEKLWENSIEPGAYLDEIIQETALSSSGDYTREIVREWLSVPKDFDEQLALLSKTYKDLAEKIAQAKPEKDPHE